MTKNWLGAVSVSAALLAAPLAASAADMGVPYTNAASAARGELDRMLR